MPHDAVGFYATIDGDAVSGLAAAQPIVFKNVQVNAGEVYDNTTGAFTAPIDGLYLFTVAITSNTGDPHELQVALKKNNDVIARAHAHGDSGHYDQGGITSVTALSTGDKVTVELVDPDGGALAGSSLSAFGGYQIVFK